MRVLRVSNTVNSYALGFQTELSAFMETGNDVVWAANFSNFKGNISDIPCKTVHVNIRSNPFCKENIVAYRKLLDIIEQENIEAIYCSTPIGGTIARLAAHKKRLRPVIYAAHGFLFFKGNSIFKNLAFKLHELCLAKWTDCLIVITDEDMDASSVLKLRNNGNKYLVHGAGIEVSAKVDVNVKEKRAEMGVPQDAFVLVSGGYLNENKNNKVIIKALGEIKRNDIFYVVCGTGSKLEELKSLAYKCGVQNQVLFLGYRTDFAQILASSDCFVMPSYREGVPRSLLEAMDLGIPCIGSCTRGIRELIGKNQEGGFLCNPNDYKEFAKAIECVASTEYNKESVSMRNKAEASKYSKEGVKEELINIINRELVIKE